MADFKYICGWNKKDGESVRTQYFTSEHVSHLLESLEEWGCHDITITSNDAYLYGYRQRLAERLSAWVYDHEFDEQGELPLNQDNYTEDTERDLTTIDGCLHVIEYLLDNIETYD